MNYFMARLSILLPLLAILQLFSPLKVIAADSTSFDPTKVEIVAQNVSGVPVGTIIAWPVATNPEDMDNWLECNGQSISQTVYPELFALVGGTVPDLRGLFLRGHGGKSAALGVTQSTVVGKHDHKIFSLVGGDSGWPDVTLAMGPEWWGWRDTSPVGGHQLFQVDAGTGMGDETRPVNQAVRYLLRARP